jgi:hypothetical protein
MDDHVLRHNGERFEYPRGFWPLMARHLRQAAHVVVISGAMRDFYRKEFGVDSTVIFGGATVSGEPDRAAPNATRDGPVRLAYFGAVDVWQKDALAALAAVLPKIGAILDIYSAFPPPPDIVLPGVTHRGFLSPREVPATMRQYDAVVLPISFRADLRNMTDLNIATKMSELLASGTLTLVVGPRHAAMVQFLLPHDAALMANQTDIATLAAAVAACRDLAIRARLLANAARLVRAETSIDIMRDRWERVSRRLG